MTTVAWLQSYYSKNQGKQSVKAETGSFMPVRDICFYFRRNSNHLRLKKYPYQLHISQQILLHIFTICVRLPLSQSILAVTDG